MRAHVDDCVCARFPRISCCFAIFAYPLCRVLTMVKITVATHDDCIDVNDNYTYCGRCVTRFHIPNHRTTTSTTEMSLCDRIKECTPTSTRTHTQSLWELPLVIFVILASSLE